MRFLVIDFDVIERGGINRIVEGLKYGLESAGCVFDYYWASRGGKLRSLSTETPTMVNDRYYRLAAGQISYGRKDSEASYAKLVKNYDVVFFMLPCPHDIKGKNGDMSWTMLYEVAVAAGKPIMGIIHDNLWDKYYEWYRQVSDLVQFHLFTCYQAKYDSLSRLPGNFVFLPTPLDVRKAALYAEEKVDALCWMPQWKKWKGIYSLLEALPSINYPVNLYNSGIEYHNARQDTSGIWKRAIGLNHVNKTRGNGNPAHQYWGSQLPDIIPGIYKSHAASIDLSGSIGERFDGQTSCVMLEAMVYGCISVVHEKVAEHPWSPLAGKDVTWTVPSDASGIAGRVNELLGDKRKRTRLAARALDFVSSYGDARTAAYTILSFLEDPTISTDITMPYFFDDVCADPVPVHEQEVYDKKPYVSKYSRSAVPDTEDVVDGIEEEGQALAVQGRVLSGADSGIDRGIDQVLQLVRAEVADGNWMAFITEVAQAWLKHFG
jgi:hypothetical protein